MRLRIFLAAALAAISITSLFSAPAAAQTKDSTQVGAAGALPPSNCPNINGTWYAAGQVPPGYYKSGTPPYDCKPIPSCPGNQFFNTGAEACQCPGGTSWDSAYGTCHTPCAGGTAWNGSSCASICGPGTAWNGSSCASICTGGQTWNGSACACPSGSNWNGSSCISCGPGTAWNGSSCVSVCTGGQTWNGSSCSCPGGSNWNGSSCVTCGPGTAWNGSSCASVCGSGQAWNGSTCVSVCSGGQTWNGSACGSAPSFGSFSVGPSNVTIGSSYTVSWSTSGTGPVTLTLSCSGANSAAYTLSPSSSGTGSLPAMNGGTTNCTATASNSWGSTSASANGLTASCPPGTVYAAGSCGTPAAVGSFSLSNATIGSSSTTASWSAGGSAPLNASMSCSGPGAGSYTLSPANSGSRALASTASGTTSCSATFSNSWGSVTAYASGSVTCPGGTSWNGSSCIAAAPTCPPGQYVNASNQCTSIGTRTNPPASPTGGCYPVYLGGNSSQSQYDASGGTNFTSRIITYRTNNTTSAKNGPIVPDVNDCEVTISANTGKDNFADVYAQGDMCPGPYYAGSTWSNRPLDIYHVYARTGSNYTLQTWYVDKFSAEVVSRTGYSGGQTTATTTTSCPP